MDNISQSKATNGSCLTDFRIFWGFLANIFVVIIVTLLSSCLWTKQVYFVLNCGYPVMVRHCAPPQKHLVPHQWTRLKVQHKSLFTACLCLSSAHPWSVPFPFPAWGQTATVGRTKMSGRKQMWAFGIHQPGSCQPATSLSEKKNSYTLSHSEVLLNPYTKTLGGL